MPNGTYGQVGGAEYLEALKALLTDKVRKGQMGIEEANRQGAEAYQMVASGVFGATLPFYGEIYEPREWWRRDPSWRLGEEAGLAMAQPPELRYFTQLGLSPSEALSWAKYLQPEVETPAGLTPEEEFDWWSRRQEYQWEIAQRPTAPTQYQQWQMKQAGQVTPEAELPPEMVFEAERQAALGGLTAPRNWIRRWQIEHMVNPYKEWEESAKRARKKGWIGTAPIETLMETAPGQRPVVGTAREPIGYKPTPEEEASYRQYRLAGLKEGKVPKEPEKAPPVPGWLTQFVPGLTAGQTLEKMPVRTPSGQAWAKLPPSQREMLAGYTEWAGGRPYEDIYEAMMRARPATPVGATRPTWIPPRQWA